MIKSERDDRMVKEKIVLAYSGGLDTSVAIYWLKEKYSADEKVYTIRIVWAEDGRKVFHDEENGVIHHGFHILLYDRRYMNQTGYVDKDEIVTEDEVLAKRI